MSELDRKETEREAELERFRSEVKELVEFMAGAVVEEPGGDCLFLDPYTMFGRTFEELKREELRIFKKTIFNALGINPKNLRKDHSNTYSLVDRRGEEERIFVVNVITSPLKEFTTEGRKAALHLIHERSKKRKMWAVGPADARVDAELI